MKRVLIMAAVLAVATTPAFADGPVLESIAGDGIITIGHREASVPFSYINEESEVVGYSIDLCLEIVADIEERLGQELSVEFVPVTPQTRIALVANGTVDLECGSTTNNLARQEQVAFSPITYVTGTRLLVTTASEINEIEDMDGMRIAVAQGAANERAVAAAAEAAGIEIGFLYVQDIDEGMLALETDRVDALTSDDILLFGLLDKARDPDSYEVTGRFLSYEPYGIMMRRDDPDFQLLVRSSLAELFRTREVDAIYTRWFEPMGVPITEQFEAARDLQALN